MTARERIEDIKRLSEEICTFLKQQNGAMSAKSLIREYCRQNNVKPTEAELGLVRLLNQGMVETNRDLQLEVPDLEHA